MPDNCLCRVNRYRFLPLLLCICFVLQLSGQPSPCKEDFPPLRLLKSQLAFDSAKAVALQMYACAASQNPADTLSQISAAYYQSEFYRISYDRDSFYHYHQLSFSLAEQALAAEHPFRVKTIHRAGIVALLENKLSEAKSQLDLAGRRYDAANWRDFEFELDLLQAYGSYYEETGELQKANDFIRRGIAECRTKATPLANERLGALYSNLAAIIEKQGDALEALAYNQRSLDTFFRFHDNTHPEALLVYNNLGNDYMQLGQQEQAAYYLEQAYECLRQTGRSERSPTDVILNNLGHANYQRGDVDKAIRCYQKAIAIRREAYGEEHPRTLLSKLHLGSMHIEREQPRLAVELLENVRTSLEQTEGQQNYLLAVCNNNLAIAYRVLKNYEQAQSCYQRALNLYETGENKALLNQAQTYRNMAQLHIAQEEYPNALSDFSAAARLFEEVTGPNSSETVYTNGAMAEVYYRSGDFAKAKARLTEAFSSWGFEDASPPDFDTLSDKVAVLKLLKSAVDCYWASYQNSAEVTDLQELLAYAKTALLLLDHQQRQSGTEQTKVLLTHQYYGLYERLIQAELTLSEYHEQADAANRAADFAEQAKGSALLDAVRQSGAVAFAGVPDSVSNKSKTLHSNINFLEKQLLNAPATSAEAGNLQKQIFNLKQALEYQEENLQKAYPAYFNMIREKAGWNAVELAADLPANTALISYFMGEDMIALFGIYGNKRFSHLTALPANFEQQLKDFLGLLSTPPEAISPAVDPFFASAQALYKIVFQAVAANLPPEITHLLIIPDGILAYLPFEVLVPPPGKEPKGFRDIRYLCHQYAISYAPSATIWQQMQHKVVKRRGTLVMAPEFSARDTLYANLALTRSNYLGQLYFNQEEAQKVGAISKARPIRNQDATLAHFNSFGPEADIIHLATHAKMEEQYPRYSFLAFAGAERAQDSSRLYLADIYNMELAANMVVLSACETGLGTLRRGEGMMSLARGFAYAGAKSIVPSLWAVNDQATAIIMAQFYENLQEGMPKGEALNAAKLVYLNSQTSDQTAHPYYWAPFIVIGDAGPVAFASTTINWWWALAALALIAILWFSWRRRESSKA